MKRISKFLCLIFVPFTILSRVNSFDDCRVIKNCSLIAYTGYKYYSKFKNLSYVSGNSILILNNSNKSEAFILTLLYDYNKKFEKEYKMDAYIKINIENFNKDILKIVSDTNQRLNLKDFDINDNFKLLGTKNINKFVDLECIRQHLGLKIDIYKKGRIFYTVPSEDKLDDIHLVYESGNERKEFVFTNLPGKPIVPVDEVEKLGKKPEIKSKKTIMSQISSFFGFSTKPEEVKSEGYDYVDEHTKLKEKIY